MTKSEAQTARIRENFQAAIQDEVTPGSILAAWTIFSAYMNTLDRLSGEPSLPSGSVTQLVWAMENNQPVDRFTRDIAYIALCSRVYPESDQNAKIPELLVGLNPKKRTKLAKFLNALEVSVYHTEDLDKTFRQRKPR